MQRRQFTLLAPGPSTAPILFASPLNKCKYVVAFAQDIMALKNAGPDPRKTPITELDFISEARAAIRAGKRDASFTYPTFGHEGSEAALTLLRGGKLAAKERMLPSVTVTHDNVARVEPIF